jgi:hypothetical protein
VHVSINEENASLTVQTTGIMQEELLPDGTRGTPNERWLSEIYRELLGRQIDSVGLTNGTIALAQAVSRSQIVLSIENSVEYRTKLINSLYFTLLGRAVDPVGLDAGLRLLAGMPLVPFTRPTLEQLEAGILSSAEYFQKHGGTNAGFLEGVYHDVLGRDIEPAVLAARSAQLAAGTSRFAEAMQILTSAEAVADRVEATYRLYMVRDVDTMGLADGMHALLSGMRDENFLANLMASDEYFARTVP